jgi:putative sigma-54 modulation protein
MEIKVHGKNSHVSESLERFTTEKVGKLSKFLPDITRIEVELYEEGKMKNHNHIAEVTVLADGPSFRTKTRSSDHRACIDIAVDRLARQLTSFHRKRMHKPAHARPSKEVAAAAIPVPEPSPEEDDHL